MGTLPQVRILVIQNSIHERSDLPKRQRHVLREEADATLVDVATQSNRCSRRDATDRGPFKSEVDGDGLALRDAHNVVASAVERVVGL